MIPPCSYTKKPRTGKGMRRNVWFRCPFAGLSVLLRAQFLHVHGVLLGEALQYGGLVELLTGAQLLDDTGLFKFSLEFLQGAFYVFALFHGYYDHCFGLFFILLLRILLYTGGLQN